MIVRSFMVAAAFLLAGCSKPATPQIAVSDAWARATAPGQSSGAIYATIENPGGADRLVGVSSSTGMAMLHGNETSNGIVRMRMVTELPVPAGGRVSLAPGGTHVMLTGLATPLIAGSKLEVTFRFAASGARTVPVAIVAPGAR